MIEIVQIDLNYTYQRGNIIRRHWDLLKLDLILVYQYWLLLTFDLISYREGSFPFWPVMYLGQKLQSVSTAGFVNLQLKVNRGTSILRY